MNADVLEDFTNFIDEEFNKIMDAMTKEDVKRNVKNQLDKVVCGQHELPWLAFYDHGRTLGVVYDDKTDRSLNAMLKTGDLGWWFPYEDLVVLTDRPTELHLDPDGRLHCEDGPAIAYADGWEIYAWSGRRVPSWTILDPTPEKIAAETNVEIRRCAIESLGWANYVEQSKFKLVDKADDPGNPGQVVELYDVPEEIWGDRVRVVIVTNGSPERDGTRRRYGLSCPIDSPDAITAVAWTVGESKAEYLETQRRT